MIKECPHCNGTGKFEVIPLSLKVCKKCKHCKIKNDVYPIAGGENVVTEYRACILHDKIFGSRIEEGERLRSDCIHIDKHRRKENK